MTVRLHSPVPATLRIHRSALDSVGVILGRLWLSEGDCLTVKDQAYVLKLQRLEDAHKEAEAALRDLAPSNSCCQECADTADEWARFESERPSGTLSPEARVETAEIEARANGWYSYSPTEDEHPVACGGGELPPRRTIRVAAANTSLDREVG